MQSASFWWHKTTFVQEKFEQIAFVMATKYPSFRKQNTICQATRQRQTEAYELSQKCDAMIVIGGRPQQQHKKIGANL